MTKRMRSVGFWAVGFVGLSLLVAACSSSSPAGSSGGSHASPIRLGLLMGLSGPNAQPWVPAAAKVGAAAVNASGGVDGHSVEIDVCDDQSTTQGAALCAQKLIVQDKDLMLIGSDGLEAAGYLPILSANHTFSWGDSGASPQALVSPLVYMFTPNLASFWVLPKELPSSTKRVEFVLADYPAALQSYQIDIKYLAPGVQQKDVVLPVTATTYDSYCLQIKQFNAQAVIFEGIPAVLPPMIQTCLNYGVKATWAISSVELTPQLVTTISNDNVPNVVNMDFGGGIQAFASDTAKYGPEVGGVTNTVADGSYSAWLAVKTLPKMVAGAGSINAAVIEAWLNKQTAFSMLGVTPPFNWTTDPDSSLPALKNLAGYSAKIENGKVVLLSNTPTVVSPTP